uniref:Uncharacterized protein n=1 Tax=Rhodosorus marinus TaxID=101924 RepID=A0A7S2ZGB0_9RHOD|mmetsp:Transcript_186/g.415  ORF Transcript_186/g.415 Transcript_186/m.415 type:complete len:122 (+) Transcript_186:162-527(+)|eukprot:CAMPEP_0113968496 /NCGR_PEP_ID=MMETSP0011_2-20120614/9578_1 /TAXON_ID=101924 /ORGANISM="Rhodosorus marinus" /LENGTH=121 /DNA_ID=CAMNT_0000981617 /DNA_START=86 /DNA_END=451 /DNA_ORIENTATION=+ /assembly_acc=CAM_ASM_000156
MSKWKPFPVDPTKIPSAVPPLYPGDLTETNWVPPAFKWMKRMSPNMSVFVGTSVLVVVPTTLYYFLWIKTRTLPETMSKEWREETARQFREGKQQKSYGLDKVQVEPIREFMKEGKHRQQK